MGLMREIYKVYYEKYIKIFGGLLWKILQINMYGELIELSRMR